MNQSLGDLIVAMASYVTEHGSYVTKTKLLKLLYLFDVEFYRVRRKTFTGLRWKYFHLGPWTKEFDSVLSEVVLQGALVEIASTKPEYDTKLYRSAELKELGKCFAKYSDEAILKTVLDTWGGSPTSEILDYVYFHTEPMEGGIRNEPLDFTRISDEVAPRYTKTSSGKSQKEISKARRAFEEEFARKGGGRGTQFPFTPPNYDVEFTQALQKLDNAE